MKLAVKFIFYLPTLIILSSCADLLQPLSRIFPPGSNTYAEFNKAVLVLSESSHDFGKQSIGSVNNYSFTVTNTGRSAASQIVFGNFSAPFSFKGGSFPGIGGNCANVLQPDASCTIVVTFLPNALVVSNQEINIRYQDSFNIYSIPLTLKGEGNFIANLRFSLNGIDPISQFDWGTLAQGNSLQKTIYILYSGTVPATGVSFSGLSAPFSILSSSCGTTISANCSLQVLFNATTVGSYQKDLKVTYANGAYDDESKLTISSNVLSNPVPGRLTFSGSYSFGKILVGQSVEGTVTVNYSGTIPATQVSPSWNNASITFKGGNYPGVGGTCGTTINSNCTLVLSFSSTAVIDISNQLTLSYYDGSSQQSAVLNISAYGRLPAVVTASATTNPLDFGIVPFNKSISKAITLTNAIGKVNATSFTYSGLSSPFTIGNSNCSSLAEGSSCTVNISYKPTNIGPHNGTIQISYFNGVTYQNITYNVTGTGTKSPLLEYCGGSYNFGSILINTTKTLNINLCYYGGDAINSFEIKNVNLPFGTTAQTTCVNPISANCVVQFIFSPTVANTYTNPAEFSYTNAAGQTTSIPFTLIGTATSPPPPTANLVVSNNNFGATPINGSGITNSISVTNTGTIAATNILIDNFIANSFFSVVNHNCTNPLAASATCSINVFFNPTFPGNRSENLTVSYFNGVTNKNASGVMSGAGTITPQIAANGDHSCAITNIAEVKCWGHNNYGQLGLGDLNDRYQPSQTVSLGQNKYAVKLALGYWHSCAILNDGSVKCWGWNLNGQLGAGSSALVIGDSPNEMGDNLAPINLGGKAISVSAGYAHTCAVLENNTLKCWGANDRGQLGLGDLIDRGQMPADMQQLPIIAVGGLVSQVAADTSHTCALLQNGSVKCWGDNTFGQLGLGDNLLRSAPAALPIKLVSAPNPSIATSIAAGGAYNCAILQNNTVKCWGRNDSVGNLGQLWCQNVDGFSGPCNDHNYPLPLIGYGLKPNEMGDHLPPVDLGSSQTPISLYAGTSHMCVLFNNNSTKCWGSNTYGELGQGDKTPRGASSSSMGNNLLKLDFGTNRTVQSMSIGSAHGCVVLDNQKIKCWGDNRFGELGLNDAGLNKCRGDEPNEMGNNLPVLGL